MPFETVQDARDWLDEEPPTDEVVAALEEEQESKERVTAIEAFEGYLEEYEEDPKEGIEFVAVRSFDEYDPGDALYLDPDGSEAMRLRNAGLIKIN